MEISCIHHILSVILLFLPLNSAQFDYGDYPDVFSPFPSGGGPPPPWMRRHWRHRHGHRHRHRHRHGPWDHRHRHRGPFGRGPPPEFFEPPMEPEPALPPPVPQRPPPQPRPRPQPRPPPVQAFSPPAYNADITKMINDVNRNTAAFSRPGEHYENVLQTMKNFFTSRSGVQYDPNRFSVPFTGTTNELSVNRKVAGALFEADMILTLSQMNAIARGRSKRKVTSNTSLKWPVLNIPYRFAINDASWRQSIKNTLNHFMQNTCLRFTENRGGHDYLLFNRGEGCYSAVGRLGGPQEISIGYGCETLGMISHELGHSLGLWHEQSRPARDSYVRVRLENVVQGSQGQFDKRSASELRNDNIAYDYGSVMHYAATAYALTSNSFTIEPLQPSFTHTLGNRVAPSFLDFKALNKAYCSHMCRNSLSCQNGGYPDPNRCNRCKCPEGLAGNYCEHLMSSSCGTNLPDAISSWRNVSFVGSSNCYWRIKTRPGNKIIFQFTHVHFKCAPTCEEYVEIKFGSNHETTGMRLCCRPEFGQLTSKGDDVIIITRATSNSQFTIRYKMEFAPTALATPHGPPGHAPITRPSTVNITHQGSWTAWSVWSGCSEECGACGVRERTRTCYRGSCSGSTRQKQACNMRPCPEGTTRTRGKRSVLQQTIPPIRQKRSGPWCCARFILANGWCKPIS